jgi:hypothetical protein
VMRAVARKLPMLGDARCKVADGAHLEVRLLPD